MPSFEINAKIQNQQSLLNANVSNYLDTQAIQEVIVIEANPVLTSGVYLSNVTIPIKNTKLSSPPQVIGFLLPSNETSGVQQLPAFTLEYDPSVMPFGEYDITHYAEIISTNKDVTIISADLNNTFAETYTIYILKDKSGGNQP